MAGRNRGRANPNQDADEERRLWKEIRERAKEVDAMVARSNELGHEIVQVEAQQAALIERDEPSDAALDERLEKLYRENVKLCEQVQHIMEGKSNDMNLLDSLNILAGLREASEESAAQITGSRSTAAKARGPHKKGPPGKRETASRNTEDLDDSTTAAISTAGSPSPRAAVTHQAGRLSAKDRPSRQGSVPATREASVKIEDGAESVASSADGVAAVGSSAKGVAAGPRTSGRLVLSLGQIVFCRHDPRNYDPKKEAPEGEGILCRVTAVIGEGKQRRYEVQDADTSGEAPPPQRASVAQLIQIPEVNKGLSDLPKGKQVLAQYPDTTTFYKAEVSEAWKQSKDPENGEWVKLNFQDDEQPREVERRFVLTER